MRPFQVQINLRINGICEEINQNVNVSVQIFMGQKLYHFSILLKKAGRTK